MEVLANQLRSGMAGLIKSLLPPNPGNIERQQDEYRKEYCPQWAEYFWPSCPDHDSQRDHRILEKASLPPLQHERFEDIHGIIYHRDYWWNHRFPGCDHLRDCSGKACICHENHEGARVAWRLQTCVSCRVSGVDRGEIRQQSRNAIGRSNGPIKAGGCRPCKFSHRRIAFYPNFSILSDHELALLPRR